MAESVSRANGTTLAEALRHAQQQVHDAEKELDKARQRLARVEADAKLLIVKHYGPTGLYYGGPPEQTERVIVRRVERTVYVRWPGSPFAPTPFEWNPDTQRWSGFYGWLDLPAPEEGEE